VVRIIPLVYSALIASTPTIANAIWARNSPARLSPAGSVTSFPWDPLAAQTSAPIPMEITTAASADQYVDRSVRSLVHSERRTSRKTAGPLARPTAAGVVVTVVLMLSPGSRRSFRSAP
jgi:hypothetical protein